MNPNDFEIIKEHMGKIASLILWQSQAIRINIENPYKLVSGNYSPIYVNCRQVISNPVFMDLFCTFAHALVRSNDMHPSTVAGGETAGIPFAAYVAQRLNIPMVYVRKKVKAHGIASLVEGTIGEREQVLLVEDLITDAASKMSFIDSIQEAGGLCKNVLVVFDRNQGGKESLASKQISLYSLTDMKVTLSAIEGRGLADQNELSSVREYLHDPRTWHRLRNLEYHE